ncbi:phosphatase PAP2 family protein [Curtobacterium sp. Curtsp57]|uniref:phosphatase PAP2 family protein n=1 Tax=Curtobacterium sp. Curtsp57 TaxID=3243047 RepID=UPI0039B5487E
MDQPSGILHQPALARSAVTALVTVVVVLAMGVLLHASAVDFEGTRAFNALHVGAVAAVADGVYAVFSPTAAVLLTVVATAVIWATRRDLRPAATFAAVIAGTWLPSAIVKLVVGRDRPDLSQLAHPVTPAQVDASYPSGHSVFITAAAIAVVLLLADTRAARIARVVAPIVVVLVLVSLLVDGVHFPTDVVASVVWALGVAPFVRAVWLRGIAPRSAFLR